MLKNHPKEENSLVIKVCFSMGSTVCIVYGYNVWIKILYCRTTEYHILVSDSRVIEYYRDA